MSAKPTRRILTLHEASNGNLISEAQAANVAKKPLEIFRRNVDLAIYPKPTRRKPKLWDRTVLEHCLERLADHNAIVQRGGNLRAKGPTPVLPCRSDFNQWIANMVAASPYPVSDQVTISLPPEIKKLYPSVEAFNSDHELRVCNFPRLLPRSIWKKVFGVRLVPSDRYRHIIIPERFDSQGRPCHWHFHCLLLLAPHEQTKFRRAWDSRIKPHIKAMVEKQFDPELIQRAADLEKVNSVKRHLERCKSAKGNCCDVIKKEGAQHVDGVNSRIMWTKADNGMAFYAGKNIRDVPDEIWCSFLG